jgi:Flp pilus assembly protein TadD
MALAAALGGCALAGHRSTQSTASTDISNVGLAIRAEGALASKNYPAAVDFAERAVEFRPEDPAYRAVLGNAYFGSGRFESAATAYKDSLRLNSNQPDVLLKLVLVTIAQGRNAEAIDFLQAGRSMMDAGNYGLALALAGQPAEATTVLEQAARNPAAGARVRQNLALAYALAGQWDQARTVVAQDLPGNLVDSRIQQWMSFATPAHASDQIASLVGVGPAQLDPGQPVRLALNRGANTRLAAAAPIPTVPAVAAPVADAAPAVSAPPPMVAMASPVAAVEVAPLPEPVFVEPQVAAAVAPPPPPPAAEPSAPVRAASYIPKRPPVRAAVAEKPMPSSTAVVQLGAYSSRDRVQVAWNRLSSRFHMVRNYSPMSARFHGDHGTVYRLSIKGFDSSRDAIALCRDLRKSGGNCFVRTVAGDSPVRFASR